MSLTFPQIIKIPNDQYSCTECDLIPEIIDIDYESGVIKIKCPNPSHGEKNIYISKYFSYESNYLNYNAKCDFTNNLQKDFTEIFKFCYNCNKMCCPKCSYSHNVKKHNYWK